MNIKAALVAMCVATPTSLFAATLEVFSMQGTAIGGSSVSDQVFDNFSFSQVATETEQSTLQLTASGHLDFSTLPLERDGFSGPKCA